jgi:hypothetical protein
VQLLLWRAIREAKLAGLHTFDLGRTDLKNTGLIAFKDRWGASRSTFTYVRLLSSPGGKTAYPDVRASWAAGLSKKVLHYLPDWMFRSVGALLYRHIG